MTKKKILFAALLLLLVLCSGTSAAFAHSYIFSDEEYVDFTCVGTPGTTETSYYFEFTAHELSITDAKTLYYIDSKGGYVYVGSMNPGRVETNADGTIKTIYADARYTLSNDLDITDFVVKCGVQYASVAFETFYFEAEYNAAAVDPSPEPVPTVAVSVVVDGLNAVCCYSTGGCNSVSSFFELQIYPNGRDDPDLIYDTIDRVDFVDGNDTYNAVLSSGQWYRTMVSYTYLDSSGARKTKTAYSDFFQAEPADAEPSPTLSPTPTSTPTPKPTVSPVPKPEQKPALSVKVDVNGYDSVCTYSAGGCNSVSSFFELQVYPFGKDDPDLIYDTIDRITFVDGSGTYEYEMNRGECYRGMVSYTYLDSSGTKQTAVAYSDFFTYEEDAVADPKVIWNLKSLMAWIWSELMEIEITYEGFTVTFKQIFLFSMIAPTLILFIIYLLGMHSAGFLFGEHHRYVSMDEMTDKTPRIEDPWTEGSDFIMRDKKE